MKPSTERVLTMLREAGDDGVSTGQFAAGYCPRAAARICELRKAGFVVSAHRVRDNAYVFRLQSEPSGLDGVSLQYAVEPSGDQRAEPTRADPPAPPTSDASLPAEVGLTLFELPAPGEDPDCDRWHGADVWGDAA